MTSSSWIQLVLGGKCALHGSVERQRQWRWELWGIIRMCIVEGQAGGVNGIRRERLELVEDVIMGSGHEWVRGPYIGV